MTHVTNSFAETPNNTIKIYIVEVMTFAGESVIVEVEARNSAEAQRLAASRVPDADYTMVQGCYSGW